MNSSQIVLSGSLLSNHSPRNNSWHIGVLRVDQDCLEKINGNAPKNGSRDINFTGFVRGNPGDRVLLKGCFKHHDQYGDQFDAKESEIDRSVESGGLATYIANHPKLYGIGPKRAEKIVKKYGNALTDACQSLSVEISVEFSIPVETVNILYEILTQDKVLLETKTWLSSLQLTDKRINKLIDQYGWRTRQILESDPYLMINDIEGFGFFRADQVARKIGLPEDADCRLRAGVLYELQKDVEEGHCWTDEKDLIKKANKSLALNSLDSKERIQSAISQLILDEKLIRVENKISLPWIYQYEEFLKNLFEKYYELENPHFEKIPLDSVPPELNEDQRLAYLAAMYRTLCLITGGAGVGKTFLIKSIADAYKARGKTVLLAAPTGKAARRIEESTGIEAETIHKLLLYDGRTWGRDKEFPLEADAIIVDEFSMVDSALAWRLFQAVDLRRTAVVMVGDHNQLPPVGPGEPLKDLVDSQRIQHVVLKKVIRQAGILKMNSSAILDDEIRPTPKRDSNDNSPFPWYLFNEYSDPDALRRFLVDCFDQYLEESFGFDLLKDVQVLAPMRKGPIGTDILNQHLQKIIQKKLYGVDITITDKPPEILYGDKVIQNRNNRELNVMNGTLGVVSKRDEKGVLYVVFEDRIERRITKSDQKDLSLAYALTVHKAQGSEFPCVISICHRKHSHMLNKNLIYTAITRARKVSILLGDKRGCRYTVSKGNVSRRRTFLGE